MRAALYWHTLRHLRPGQIFSRLAFRWSKPQPDLAQPPALRATTGAWVPAPPRRSTRLTPLRFRFLNIEREVTQAYDWNHPQWEKLWLYNLHYCDDVDAPGYHAAIESWRAANPPVAGNGWEPYPTSLRIVNWIKWALAGNTLSWQMQHSLAIQCRHLLRRLEWHLLGNHLFANAKALVFAGLFFQGDEADSWLAAGLRILQRELPEQILPDGGHFELSPMYHSLILEDLLDLENLTRVYVQALPDRWSSEFRVKASDMLRWLATMTHPDGRIAFMNDAAFGIASEPSAIAAYAARLNIFPAPGVRDHLADSGYLRIERGTACAILDVGRIGPDYLPGHAHADTLSFELSLAGRRSIVNSGTSTYEPTAERLRQRSTAAHSTLEINGENSSQVWGSFRVARRAQAFGLHVARANEEIRVSCAHDGYKRLSGHPVHRREWRLSHTQMEIIDTVDGKFNKAVAHFYFHPDCLRLHSDHNSGAVSLGQGTELHWSIEGGHGRLINTTYHPEFGLSQPNVCLQVETVDNPLRTVFNWRG